MDASSRTRSNTRDLQCATSVDELSNLPPEIPPPDPNPMPDCVEANPGEVASMSKGLQSAVRGPATTGGGLSAEPSGTSIAWPISMSADDDDPRVVVLFVADYGAFDPNGLASVLIPIAKFADVLRHWLVHEERAEADRTGTARGQRPAVPRRRSVGRRQASMRARPTPTRSQGAVWGYFISDFKSHPGL